MRLSTNYTLRLLWILLCLLSSLICLNATDIDCPFAIETLTYQITVSDNRYIIDFSLPSYEINNIDVEGEYPDIFHQYGQFHSIEVEADNYDVTDNIGYPELPFFPIELLLPSNSSNVHIHLESSYVEEVELPHYIAPAIKGNTLQITEDGEYMEIEQDEDYCAWIYPTIEQTDGFYLLSEPYDVFGTKGVTLSVLPFVYRPNNHNRLEVLESGRLVIEFDGEPLSSAINRIKDMETFKSAIAMQYFEKFPWPDIPDGGRYHPWFLIVAATQDMGDSLQTFVDYKLDLGYNVKVIYLEEYNALGDPQAIRYIIRENDPDYVLLVGSLEQIPPLYGSNDANNPYSDDGYHSSIGRWIAMNNEQIGTIIRKTIDTQWNISFSNSSIYLLSGTGEGEKQFYKNIEKIAIGTIDKMGLPYTLHDGQDGGDYNTFRDAVQNSTMVVYRGHGGNIVDYRGNVCGSFIASPYNVGAVSISEGMAVDEFDNGLPFPMGFGIACSLNTYETNDNFGAKWVNSESGGVTFYGSTTASNRSQNNALARKLFEVLKEKTNTYKGFTISSLLYTAETKYVNAYCTGRSRRGIETAKYNLIGDPTFKVFGIHVGFSSPRYHHKTNNREQPTSICSEILTISGQTIMRSNDVLTENAIKEQIPQGIYIIRYYMSDGEYITDKIVNF